MKSRLKKLTIIAVVGFALVGLGGTVAFASGNLIVNIQANFDTAKGNLNTIRGLFKDKDTEIANLGADKAGLEATKVKLEADKAGLETANAKLTSDLKSANATSGAYKTQVDKAVNLLAQFNTAIETENGTKHKLDSALVLITELSDAFDTQVDLDGLKTTIEEAQKDNTDLNTADDLMRQVAEETQLVIEEQQNKTQ